MIDTIIKKDEYILKLFAKNQILERDIFTYLDTKISKLFGIVGLRGTGKTSYLLRRRRSTPSSIYISCDDSSFLGKNLFDIVDELRKIYNFNVFFLDEIQEIPHRDMYLKNIYDFLDVQVVFSGSNMIDITRGGYDLSRRATLYHMPLFSFADYIRITKDFPLLPYTFEDIITNHFQIAKEHSTWYSKVLFEEYLNYGEFGYFYEKTDDKILFNDRLDNAIKKSVFQDLPKFVDISTHNLSKVQELIYFLAEAGTSDISLNSLSKKINLSVKTTDIYISFLHKIGIIHILDFYGNTTDKIRKNKKYILGSANIIKKKSDNIGVVREAFFVSCIHKIINQNGCFSDKISYQSQTDFVVETGKHKYLFEIGGKSKSRSESNLYVIKDNITIGQGNNIPLRLFGLL